ncbi:MAG: C25 family cysteine peptidase, partial [Cyclobacteriaceae bacterium]|nr:C25 family cysteine peptidase [Cyclobacteriaceae bacterium]
MRINGLVFLFLFSILNGLAQNIGNEWINFNQEYFKIPIGENGIYSISYEELNSAGFPLANINSNELTLFHRGVEHSIKIEDGGDGVFEPGDYFLFYGEKNDGTLDKQLYREESAQPHNYHNLYSDTTYYFITRNITGNGKRMTEYYQSNTSSLSPDLTIKKTLFNLQANRYTGGNGFVTANGILQSSVYDFGEGWTGKRIQENELIDFLISGVTLTNTLATKPQLEIMILGESPDVHVVELQIGKDAASLRPLGSKIFSGYKSDTIFTSFEWSDISAGGQVLVRILAKGFNGGNDLLSVPYIKLDYQRQPDLNHIDGIYRLNSNPGNESYIEVINIPLGTVLYDITIPSDPSIPGFDLIGNQLNAIIAGTSIERKVFFTSTVKSSRVEKVFFREFNPSLYNYYILTHPTLREPGGIYSDPVKAYAEYRASAQGGSFDTLLVEIDELYDQFSYGEKTPLAIFNFLKWMYSGGKKSYFLIIGRALDVRFWFYRTINPGFYRDLVPTAGYPGSDNIFSMGLDGMPGVPAIPTGRISAYFPWEVANYLDKVKEMEQMPFDHLWRKRVLHLSGGILPDEQQRMFGYLESYKAIAEDVYLGGKVSTIRKNTTDAVEFINVSTEVNNGLNLITFFGHSSRNVTDIDIGFVSDPANNINNPGKYPNFLVNGCEAGLIFTNRRVFSEDWIRSEKKGAISFLAHSSLAAEPSLNAFSNYYYQLALGDSSFMNQPMGDMLIELSKRYAADYNLTEFVHATQLEQMVLQGDPFLSVFGARKVDYAISDPQLYIRSLNNEIITAQSDSFALDIVVKNYGVAIRDSITVRVERIFENGLS